MKHGGITRRQFMERTFWCGGAAYAVLHSLRDIQLFATDAAEATEATRMNAEERVKLIEETAELAKFYELEYYG